MKRVAKSFRSSLFIALAVLAGCQKLEARKQAQEGNRLFKDGHFAKARDHYEDSLKKENLMVTHHNLALTYNKMFQPGCDPKEDKDSYGRLRCPDNAEFAEKAAEHFSIYLKSDPKNNQIRDLMSKIWIDTDQFDKAIAYWQTQLDSDPQNGEIMGKLAGINFKAKNWRAAMDWYVKQADVSTTPNSKTASYQSIGYVGYSVLSNKKDTTYETRVECADRAIGAMEKAIELNPKRPELHGLLGSIHALRSIAQGPLWAAAVDRASGEIHAKVQRVLYAEAKAAQQGTTPTPAPTPAPATPGSASGSADTTPKTGG